MAGKSTDFVVHKLLRARQLLSSIIVVFGDASRIVTALIQHACYFVISVICPYEGCTCGARAVRTVAT
jgi:hypothetical protein